VVVSVAVVAVIRKEAERQKNNIEQETHIKQKRDQ